MRNLLFALVGMVLLANFGFSATIYVNATDGTACGVGGSSYQFIQDAIDFASEGDTIIICAEATPYTQDFGVDKPLNVFGSEAGVEIRAPGPTATMRITAMNVNVTNLTLGNTETDAVLLLSNYTRFYGNTVSNSAQGIQISDAAGAVLESNNITSNAFTNISGVAVLLNASSGNTINLTRVAYNSFAGDGNDGKAFYAKISSGKLDFITFLGNNVSGFLTGVEDDGSMNSVYANGTISNSSFIADGMSGAFISGILVNWSASAAFTLTGCDNNVLRDNRAYNNSGTGFLIYSSSDYNTLFNNSALNNTPYGFHVLGGANSNNLTNNTAAYNANTGIIVEASFNNTLFGNTAYNDSGYAAFYVYTGGSNMLANNTAYNSPYGISVIHTLNNTLRENSVYDNIIDGVQLINATYCNLTGNNASGNTNDGFALYTNSNFNIFDSNIAEHNGHEDETFAFNGILLDHSSGNTFTGDFLYNNSDLGVYLNTSENNTFAGSISSFNDIGGFYAFESDYNTFTGVAANGNLDYGFYLQNSSNSNISSAQVYSNFGYGIILGDFSGNNTISGSNISSSIVYGIYLFDSSDNFINNTNISNIYLAGIILSDESEGNELVGLNVSDNDAIGIGLSVEYQNSITDSVVAENGLFDVLPLACFSGAIDNVTGSGGRPINYSNSSVDWQDFEASAIILCDANNSNITNVTVRGSDVFNNNALILWNSANVRVTGSNSSGNYMGFYIYASQNATLANNTAMNTSYSSIVLESSPNATIRGSTIGNNFANDIEVFGLGSRRVGISLWDSQDAAMYDNAITGIWNSSAILLEAGSSTEGFQNNTITNATKGIEISDATLIFTGDNYIYETPAEGSDIYVEGDGYLDAIDYMVISDFLNYSIYAEDIMAKSVNLSATPASINDTNYTITLARTLGARVLKAPQEYSGLNVTSLSGSATMNLVIPYNDSDASGYDSVGVGVYSSSWQNLRSTSVDTASHLVSKDGISAPSGYFASIAYTSTPATSSSHGRNPIDLNYTFNCSTGRLEVQAAYSRDPVGDIGITLFRDGRVQSSGTTDYRGKVSFTLTQDGTYKAVSETTSNYLSEELLLGTLALCPDEAPAEEEGTTNPLEDMIAALGANQTGVEGGQPSVEPQQPAGPTRDDALAAIAAAQSAISAAESAGKDVADAQAKLQQANDALAQEDYAGAVQFANEAEQLAGMAQEREIGAPASGTQQPASSTPPARGPDWALIIGILAVLAIAAGAYYLLARKK